MKITRKLAVLVAVPLVAVVAFAALAVVTTGGEAVRAERLRQLVATGAAAGDLVHRLQAERAAAVTLLAEASSGPAESYPDHVAASTAAQARYQHERAQLSSLPAGVADLLRRIDGQLAGLEPLREKVTAGQQATSTVAFRYRILIADLIAYRESVAPAGGAPADVGDQLRAAAALSRAAEQVGLQQVAVLRAAEFGPLTPAALQEITSARTGQVEATLTFDALARPEWRTLLRRAATGAEPLAAQRMEEQVARVLPGDPLRVDTAEWTDALNGRMQRLREVEADIDSGMLAEVTALRDAQRRWTGAQTAAVLAAVIAAVALAVSLGRPVVRGLRHLRDTANYVAHQGLPGAVARLEDHESLGGLTPDEFADQAEAPVAIRGHDELAEVGAAFNAVHREAIRIAAAQALLRLHIAAIFVNLARRGQSLAGRLTTALDDAERDEQDPHRLAQLFKLDLLVTLLSRTNESLLVLGGASSAQVRTTDETLSSVLTAAAGQVEAYARIATGTVDTGVAVRADVVDEVVKLLAELMDNACRYSQAEVHVGARWLADRVIIQITDEGIGIDPARRDLLNQRLANRPPLDLAAVRAMGLTVVGHIAARHDIRVELRAGRQRGTIAEVTLPAALITVGATTPGSALTPRRLGLPAPGAPLFQRIEGPDAARQGDAGTLVDACHSEIDQTVELHLPIFEQVQSHWFGTAPALDSGEDWRTPADEGWRAAAQAAKPIPADITTSGLPRRRPGAQLVPGAVEAPPPTSGDWRDPAAVSAALIAYSRGLAAGRAHQQPAVIDH